MKRKITPPIRKRVEYMLDDRWPYQEIERTTGILILPFLVVWCPFTKEETV